MRTWPKISEKIKNSNRAQKKIRKEQYQSNQRRGGSKAEMEMWKNSVQNGWTLRSNSVFDTWEDTGKVMPEAMFQYDVVETEAWVQV